MQTHHITSPTPRTIDMALPEHLRGVELSAQQLESLQARLVEYEVVAREIMAPSAQNVPPFGGVGRPFSCVGKWSAPSDTKRLAPSVRHIISTHHE
jgi:hypothetical protein